MNIHYDLPIRSQIGIQDFLFPIPFLHINLNDHGQVLNRLVVSCGHYVVISKCLGSDLRPTGQYETSFTTNIGLSGRPRWGPNRGGGAERG